MVKQDVMSIHIKSNFKKTTKWLNKRKNSPISYNTLKRYAEEGVEALRQATPKRTGLTSNSWYYEIRENGENKIEIVWCNSNVIKDYANIAILIQYGHGTKNGSYVEGIDYITPALRPIFQKIADSVYKEVKQ